MVLTELITNNAAAVLVFPMALATAMYHSGLNPLRKILRNDSEKVDSPKTMKQRRLHKAFLRYHDAENWPLLREALQDMGRQDLIGQDTAGETVVYRHQISYPGPVFAHGG